VHTPEAQSLLSPHACPLVQWGLQVGAAHVPLVHTPEPQSLDAPHTCPSEQ
jgi:hypothetical protein